MGLRKEDILAQAQDADWKNSVRAVTLGPLPAFTRTVNAILADANGAIPTQDDVTLVVGDSLLLDEQTDPIDNGIWVIDAVGDGSNKFAFSRRDDFDESANVTAGIKVPIEEGTLFGGKIFELLTTGTITINSTSIDFDVLAAGGVDVDATTQTTDATPAVIATYSGLGNDRGIILDGVFTGYEPATDEQHTFRFTARAHVDAGGTATVEDVILLESEDAGAAPWDVDIVAGGGVDLDFQVTGEAAHTIDWRVWAIVRESL